MERQGDIYFTKRGYLGVKNIVNVNGYSDPVIWVLVVLIISEPSVIPRGVITEDKVVPKSIRMLNVKR